MAVGEPDFPKPTQTLQNLKLQTGLNGCFHILADIHQDWKQGSSRFITQWDLLLKRFTTLFQKVSMAIYESEDMLGKEEEEV